MNVRLTYISVHGSHYSSRGQVILTVSPLAMLHFLTAQKIHLVTETEQDQMRHSYLQNFCSQTLSLNQHIVERYSAKNTQLLLD